jgi:ankyrin repeat protein
MRKSKKAAKPTSANLTAQRSAPSKAATHPLFTAAINDNDDQIKKLVQAGVDVNMRDSKTGETPLHFAAMVNKQKAVKALIEMKADVNIKTANHHLPFFFTRGTPLHLAALHRHTAMINLLTAAGAEVNATDELKDTPLHNAIQLSINGSGKEAVEALLRAGADPRIKGQHGRTPAALAYEESEKTIGDLLVTAEAIFKKKSVTSTVVANVPDSKLSATATESAAGNKAKRKKKKKKRAMAADSAPASAVAANNQRIPDQKYAEAIIASLTSAGLLATKKPTPIDLVIEYYHAPGFTK